MFRFSDLLTLAFVWVNARDFSTQAPQVFIPEGIDIRLASKDDCLQAAADPEMSLSVPFVHAAFSQDTLCHAAFFQGRMVAYAWRAQSSAPHDAWVGVQITPGNSYGFKAYTHRDFRGLGLYAGITAAEYVTAKQRGLRKGVSFTQWGNTASNSADVRLGNRRVGVAGIIRSGPRAFCFHSPGATAAGFRFIPLAMQPHWPWPS